MSELHLVPISYVGGLLAIGINGKRYAYYINPPGYRAFNGLLRHSPGKALTYLKAHGELMEGNRIEKAVDSLLGESSSDETLVLYLRREPSEDHPGSTDVYYYEDPEATVLKGVCPAGKSCPRKGQSYVMFNTYRWKAVWLPDLVDRQGYEGKLSALRRRRLGN